MTVVADGTVRLYAAEDRDSVIAMLADRDPWQRLGYTEERWRALLTPPLGGREAWVIDCQGAARGIALLRLGFLRGDYLELFAIASGFEGRGFGRTLLRAAEDRAFARGANLFVCVSDFNEPARRFYAQNGYRQVGTLADLLIPGSDELLLRKTRREDVA